MLKVVRDMVGCLFAPMFVVWRLGMCLSLSLSVSFSLSVSLSGEFHVTAEQLKAVLLAFGAVCGSGKLPGLVLSRAVQSPESALVAAEFIASNSSISGILSSCI